MVRRANIVRTLFFLACIAFAPAGSEAAVPASAAKAARTYRTSGTLTARKAAAQASQALAGADRGLVQLSIGVTDFERKRFRQAAETLQQSIATGHSLGDYALYYRARSLAALNDHAGAAWVLKDFSRKHPSSRWAALALQIRVESLIRTKALTQARTLLADNSRPFAEPARLFYQGRVQELDTQRDSAIVTYRQVYYGHPTSEMADKAEARLNAIRQSMGAAYPKATAASRLQRAGLLFEARKYRDAANEYTWAAPGLTGAERDHALVRAGAANYRRLATTTALNHLSKLKVSDPAAEAERLYYVGECARRKGQVALYRKSAGLLREHFPKSPWLEEALFSLGNYCLLRDEPAEYAKFYREAWERFPNGKYSGKAHWKSCWRAYLDRSPDAAQLLEDHARNYLWTGQPSAALYWRARIAERRKNPALARRLYKSIEAAYPHYYYSAKAVERLNALPNGALAPAPAYFPKAPAPREVAHSLSPANRLLVNRAELLGSVALHDLARAELLQSDYRGEDSYLVGMALARLTNGASGAFEALRHMKRYGFGYLRQPVNGMPREYWERLFPFAFEDELRARAERQNLDPYIVAGLIRQESEFNPRARSRAGALGLMQIMPATGRGLAQRLGIRSFATRSLYQPATSLRLGTFHFRNVLNRYDGTLEHTLAGYNAGETRVERWLTWEKFAEPEEFVESIPFTETRGYVQSVLRNAAMYRKLYGGSPGTQRASAE